jgi:hypothetical protein
LLGLMHTLCARDCRQVLVYWGYTYKQPRRRAPRAPAMAAFDAPSTSVGHAGRRPGQSGARGQSWSVDRRRKLVRYRSRVHASRWSTRVARSENVPEAVEHDAPRRMSAP